MQKFVLHPVTIRIVLVCVVALNTWATLNPKNTADLTTVAMWICAVGAAYYMGRAEGVEWTRKLFDEFIQRHSGP